jgi:hypothetical protein
MTPLGGRVARIEALRAHPIPDAAAAAELCLLEAGRLDIRRTLAAIRAAAERRACLSYAAVAEASGLSWREARRRMDPHLFGLCRWARERGWPLLSAVVVEQGADRERPHGGPGADRLHRRGAAPRRGGRRRPRGLPAARAGGRLRMGAEGTWS